MEPPWLVHDAAGVDHRDGPISAAAIGGILFAALRARRLPRQILTKKAFENAIAVVMAIGGSTNAVLHLPPSRARRACLAASKISRRRACASRVVRSQAIRALRRHGSASRRGIPQSDGASCMRTCCCMATSLTIDGRTGRRGAQGWPGAPSPDRTYPAAWDRALAPTGHIVIGLRGNSREGQSPKYSGTVLTTSPPRAIRGVARRISRHASPRAPLVYVFTMSVAQNAGLGMAARARLLRLEHGCGGPVDAS